MPSTLPSTIPRILPSRLASLLRSTLSSTSSSSSTSPPPPTSNSAPSQSLAIIDVRDTDHAGGHIRSSIHAPAHTLDVRIPELVRKLRGVRAVVFHCALSQQRGPRAAGGYVDALERERVSGGGAKEAQEQEVYVLEGGFVGWAKEYGGDETLTECYDPEIWDDYY